MTCPDKVKVGYTSAQVDKYYPSPLRCGKCCQWRHSTENCQSGSLCSNCDNKGHNRNECKAEFPKYGNCKGSHDATSKNLPRYLSKREICRIKVDQKLSFKEARIKVSAGQRADASTARNSQDTMYSGGKNLSDITGSNQNSLNKLKSKSCFFSLSQLMNSSLPNNNRYSPLQRTLDEDEATEDDCNLEETYASITARENANTIDSQGSITPGQRQQKVQYKRKNIQFVKEIISTTTWRQKLIQQVNHNASIPCVEKLTSENLEAKTLL